MESTVAGVIAGLLFFTLVLAAVVLTIIAVGVIFHKAGEPAWAVIVPFYNIVVLCRVAGRPEWWIILLLIPGVSAVIMIIVLVGLAERFGKGVGFAVGLIFLPFLFLPLLAFGDAEYRGRPRWGPSYPYDDEDDRPRHLGPDDDIDLRRPRLR